jgi:hypothetical protein
MTAGPDPADLTFPSGEVAMLPYLLRRWHRWRHAAFDHIHFTPFDDGHLAPPVPPANEPHLHSGGGLGLSAERFGSAWFDRGGLGPRVDDEG